MSSDPIPTKDDAATALPTHTVPVTDKKDAVSTPVPVASEKTSAIT